MEQVVLWRRESTDLEDMVHPSQGSDSLSILDSLGSKGIRFLDRQITVDLYSLADTPFPLAKV
jgi:hypothetical protein